MLRESQPSAQVLNSALIVVWSELCCTVNRPWRPSLMQHIRSLPRVTGFSLATATRSIHSSTTCCQVASVPHGPSPNPSPSSSSHLVLPRASHTALLFPGQGSQRVGEEVRRLEAEWPGIVRPLWQEMDETLKMNLSRMMKDGLMVRHDLTLVRDLVEPANSFSVMCSLLLPSPI
jgi:hypothetical protein